MFTHFQLHSEPSRSVWALGTQSQHPSGMFEPDPPPAFTYTTVVEPYPGRTHIGAPGPHAWFEFKCELFVWVYSFFPLLIHLAVLYWLSTYAT